VVYQRQGRWVRPVVNIAHASEYAAQRQPMPGRCPGTSRINGGDLSGSRAFFLLFRQQESCRDTSS